MLALNSLEHFMILAQKALMFFSWRLYFDCPGLFRRRGRKITTVFCCCLWTCVFHALSCMGKQWKEGETTKVKLWEAKRKICSRNVFCLRAMWTIVLSTQKRSTCHNEQLILWKKKKITRVCNLLRTSSSIVQKISLEMERCRIEKDTVWDWNAENYVWQTCQLKNS